MKKATLLLMALIFVLLLPSCSLIDTILPNGLSYHTVIKYNYTDTLTIKKDRFVAKILIQNDSLYIWANYMGQLQNIVKSSDVLKLRRSSPPTYIFK